MGNDNRKKESLRIPVWMIASLLAAICTLCLPLSTGAATYTQKKPALAPYTVSSYKTVKNTHFINKTVIIYFLYFFKRENCPSPPLIKYVFSSFRR